MKRLIRDHSRWGINSGLVYPAHTNGTPQHDLQLTWLCLLPPGCILDILPPGLGAMWRVHIVELTIG
jgi:hypothetical protein